MRKKGKKITTWKFDVDRMMVAVEVRLEETKRGAIFQAINTDLEIREEHTDITELKKRVAEIVGERVKTEWSKWITAEVERLGEDRWSRWSGAAGRAKLEISWEYVGRCDISKPTERYRSLDPDGAFNTGRGVSCGAPSEQALEANGTSVKVCIPDTPSHREALEYVKAQIELLYTYLAKSLGPGSASAFLEKIASKPTGFLLNGAAAESEASRKPGKRHA